MSTHWVYEMAALGAMVAGRDAAFLDPPADAFYSYPLGSPSPYGQQARALLSSLVDARGCVAQLACVPQLLVSRTPPGRHGRSFSPEAYAARNFEVFGAPSFAASGGYLDGSTAGFVRAVRSGASWPRCGVDDAQANCIARLPPLVAAFAGDAALLPTVADMIRTTQDSPAAVAWGAAAARVLEAVILGAPPAQAVQAAIAAMQARTPAYCLLACQHARAFDHASCVQDPARAFRTEQDAEVAAAMAAAAAMAGAPHADAVTQLGRNCHLPGALQSPVHALVAVRSPAAGMNEYQAAVMDTILQARRRAGVLLRTRVADACCTLARIPLPAALQGGCNASRAGFVGACFGAHVGAGAVPPAWRAKFLLYEETLARAEALADMRA